MGADALSEVLRAVRLTGAVFFSLDLKAPWVAQAAPGAWCLPAVMPEAQHLMEFHIVGGGWCWGGLLDRPPVRLEAGDIVAFPQGDPHVLSSAPGLRREPDMEALERARRSRLPFALTLDGGGAEAARVVCGFLGCDARPFNPLLGALPRMLHLRGAAEPPGSWLGHLVRATVAESEARRAGGEGMLARMSELVFLEMVRRHMEDLPAGQTGWLAGLRDPHVGRALNLMHGRPAAAWTLDRLAREAGLSRSSLAERFARLVGHPPMHYLALWRMQVAAGLLARGGGQVAQVAEAVGYESEAAFNRAFRRLVGTPPATWGKARAATGEAAAPPGPGTATA